MDRPATYAIRCEGELDASWSERLGGMKLTVERGRDGKPVTLLVGELTDQAALSGVLNALYELRLRVLSVRLVDE